MGYVVFDVIVRLFDADGAVMEERRIPCTNRDEVGEIINALRLEFPLTDCSISDQTAQARQAQGR